MKSKTIKWNKYTDLHKQAKNIIISPTGQLLFIEYQSHDYYLEKLAEEELGFDSEKLYKLRKKANEDSEFLIREDQIIIAKLGYVSVHTSCRGICWIRGPEKLNEKQISAIITEYTLGNLPPLIYDILMNYDTLIEEASWYERKWYLPYQIDVNYVKEKEVYTSDTDFENGYSVSIF